MKNERLYFLYEDSKQISKEFVNDIEMIHDKMIDSISQSIFSNRLLFSLTKNYRYMRDILMETVGGGICIM